MCAYKNSHDIIFIIDRVYHFQPFKITLVGCMLARYKFNLNYTEQNIQACETNDSRCCTWDWVNAMSCNIFSPHTIFFSQVRRIEREREVVNEKGF